MYTLPWTTHQPAIGGVTVPTRHYSTPYSTLEFIFFCQTALVFKSLISAFQPYFSFCKNGHSGGWCAVRTRVRFALLGNLKLPKRSTEVTKIVNYPGLHFQFTRTTLYWAKIMC